MELLVPYSEGGRLHELHEVAGELERTERDDGVLVRARVPVAELYRFDDLQDSRTRLGGGVGVSGRALGFSPARQRLSVVLGEKQDAAPGRTPPPLPSPGVVGWPPWSCRWPS